MGKKYKNNGKILHRSAQSKPRQHAPRLLAYISILTGICFTVNVVQNLNFILYVALLLSVRGHSINLTNLFPASDSGTFDPQQRLYVVQMLFVCHTIVNPSAVAAGIFVVYRFLRAFLKLIINGLILSVR